MIEPVAAWALRTSGASALRSILVLLFAVTPVPAAGGAGDTVSLNLTSIEADGRFRWFAEPRPPAQPPFALALSGGGAWGIAYLGFLDAMLADGLAPDMIAGTSAGALVGATYAAGYEPAEVIALLRSEELDPAPSPFKTRGVGESAWPSDPLGPRRGLGRFGREATGAALRADRLLHDEWILDDLVKYLARADALAGGDFDRLRLPFRAVAVDLIGSKVVAPRVASLPQLVRASIGLPIFRPVEFGGQLLVDGGALEWVPVPTAREMGAEVVAAVWVSRSGDVLPPPKRLNSFRSVTARYNELALADQRRPELESADSIAYIAVGDLPLNAFAGRLDELLQAGRSAWERSRESTLEALEARSPDPRRLTLRTLRAAPASDPALAVAAEELAERLGLTNGSPVTLSALRLELELCRLQRTSSWSDARLAIGPRGVATLHAVPQPLVRDFALRTSAAHDGRFDDAAAAGRTPPETLQAVRGVVDELRRRGALFAGVERFAWDASERRADATIDEGRLDELELIDASGQALATPPLLLRLVGRPGNIESIRAAADLLAEAGGPRDVSFSAGEELAGGGWKATFEARPAPAWEAAWNAGLADGHGLAAWFGLRVARALGDWALETRVAGSRDGALAGVELGPPLLGRAAPFVRAVVGRPAVTLYDDRGRRSATLGFDFAALSGGVKVRTDLTGELEWALAARRIADTASEFTAASGEEGIDVALDVAWRGEYPRPARPGRSFLSWSLAASMPFAGRERAPIAVADIAARLPLDRRGRWALGSLARVAESGGDDVLSLDRWTEVGSWWEAAPLQPGQGLVRELRRGTLIFSRSLGGAARLPLAVGVSASIWRLGEARIDPALGRSGHGGALFVEAGLPRLGSLVVGVGDGSERGDRWFVLLGPQRLSWPGPRTALPGG